MKLLTTILILLLTTPCFAINVEEREGEQVASDYTVDNLTDISYTGGRDIYVDEGEGYYLYDPSTVAKTNLHLNEMQMRIIREIVKEFNRNRQWHGQPTLTKEQVINAVMGAE